MSRFNGTTLESCCDHLPHGPERCAALLDAIHLADAAQNHFWRLKFRYIYICEVTFHDDPPKAIPAAAEFDAILQEHPEAYSAMSAEDIHAIYLMVLQMGLDPMVALPQIPKAQWEDAIEHFYQLVKQYHLGLRTYWWQKAQFLQYVDKEEAFACFQKFWKTGRDILSDCRACERSYAVQMCLMAGDRAAADSYAKPMEAGRIRFCSHTPHKYWVAYLEDALDRRELDRAVVFAAKLYRKGNRDRGDLRYLGAILRCRAYTDLDAALPLLETRLAWAFGMWDQKTLYDFYKGAWVCFRELEKRQKTVSLALPQEFPLWQEDSSYSVPLLANWFYEQTAAIAKRFDDRNGRDRKSVV